MNELAPTLGTTEEAKPLSPIMQSIVARGEAVLRDARGKFAKGTKSPFLEYADVEKAGVWQSYKTRAAYWVSHGREEILKIYNNDKLYGKLSSFDALIVKQLAHSLDRKEKNKHFAVSERENLLDRHIGKMNVDVRVTGKLAHAHLAIPNSDDWLSRMLGARPAGSSEEPVSS